MFVFYSVSQQSPKVGKKIRKVTGFSLTFGLPDFTGLTKRTGML